VGVAIFGGLLGAFASDAGAHFTITRARLTCRRANDALFVVKYLHRVLRNGGARSRTAGTLKCELRATLKRVLRAGLLEIGAEVFGDAAFFFFGALVVEGDEFF